MRRLLGPLALCVAIPASLLGGEESSDGSDLSKVTLGEYWYGPKQGLEDLKGRVVLLEFWGFK